MNDPEQTKAFADDLDKLVERYRAEFDMTYASVIGVLQMKSFLLCEEAADRSEEEE